MKSDDNLNILGRKVKRLMVIAIVQTLLLACSTDNPSVGERTAHIYAEFNERMKHAQSIEDIAQIENESDFFDRLSSLQPEWDALVQNGDSSAYYAEQLKVKSARDSFIQTIRAKIDTFATNKTE